MTISSGCRLNQLRVDRGEGTRTARRIHPLSIVYLDWGVELLAWCCLRQDFRKFRVSRIEDPTASDESFGPNRACLLRDYIGKTSGV